MNEFKIKNHNYMDKNNPVSVYISCTTYTINPLEIEKDINNFMQFMEEKYKVKSVSKNVTFKEWFKSLLK